MASVRLLNSATKHPLMLFNVRMRTPLDVHCAAQKDALTPLHRPFLVLSNNLYTVPWPYQLILYELR